MYQKDTSKIYKKHISLCCLSLSLELLGVSQHKLVILTLVHFMFATPRQLFQTGAICTGVGTWDRV
jgi:hypothetical protein